MEEDCRYKKNLDGYEKKPRLEDTVALKEEKKEKKHKKEKKDREKREGKEKKDKDRDDGKDKEKRDKKEKHKKEKHRDKKKKDKEKGSNSETSGAGASVAAAAASILGTKTDDKLGITKEGENETFFGSNGEKNGRAVSRRQNGEENIPIPSSSSSNNNNNNLISQGMEDSNFVLELARRINDEEKVTHHNHLDKEEDSRFVQELDRRFKDEGKVARNQLDRFSAAAGKKKIDDREYILDKSPGDFVVDKKGKDRHVGFTTMDGKGIVKFGENSMVQSFAGTAKSSIGELPRTTHGKEKSKENDDKSRKKHKSKDREKKSHNKKDKDLEKEEKKAKKKKQDKNTAEPLTQEGRRNGPDNVSINASMIFPVVSNVMGSVPLSDDQRNNATIVGTEKQRKELDTNGPLNSCSAGRSYPVGFEVMGSVPLSDQRNNATVECIEKQRKELDINGLVNSSNASSCFTDVTGSIPLSGQKNHAVVVRRNEKMKQKEIATNGLDNIRTATKNYSVGATEVMGSVPLSDCRNHAIVIGNAKKRNDIDVDGFFYDNEARTSKVPRLSPPHNSLENGRKLEAHQSVKVLTSERHDGGSAKSLQVDNNKEEQHQHQHKNGLIHAKSLHILGPNPSVVLSDQIIEKSRKTIPPHPDTECLSQILTVPKMDEWNGFDDQEWLFHGQDPPPSRKPPEMGSAGVSEDLQVWSDAVSIESMDIVAFPYVLPY